MKRLQSLIHLLSILLIIACGAENQEEISELQANQVLFKKTPVVAGIDKIPDQDMAELKQLGVGHYKLNLLLNRFFRTTPANGFQAFKASKAGIDKTYYFNPSAFADFDAQLRVAKKNNPNVTLAIVILASCGADFKMPGVECPAPGTTKMRKIGTRSYAAHFYLPDLKTADGINFYRGMMDFLANRYSNPASKAPFVKYWILHNEVDIFDEWTHAGNVDMNGFMTSYMKTVQIASYSLKRYSAQSEAFISITKAWDHHHNAIQAFEPKRMMSWIIDYEKSLPENQKFKWGIAQHPYGAKPWTKVASTALNMKTQSITMANIELLNDIANCPSLKYEGKSKTIILSEQGFGSNGQTTEAIGPESNKTLSDKAWVCKANPAKPAELFRCASEGAKEQAASVLYTFSKLRYTENIKAFHYHRYQDHPEEKATFGLIDKEGNKKLGFYVLKALNQDASNAFDKNNVLFKNLWNYMKLDTSKVSSDKIAKELLVKPTNVKCGEI